MKNHSTRKKQLKLVLFITILVVFGALTTIFLGYRTASNPEQLILSAVQDDATISISNVSQISTKNGIKEWSLQARSAYYLEIDMQAVFEKLMAIFYLQNGRTVQLSADKGYLNIDSHDIRITGNVIADDGYFRIETDNLKYKNKRRILLIDSHVKVRGGAMRLCADKALYDLVSQKATFRGNVEGIIFEKITL